jgi:hypothetical protein
VISLLLTVFGLLLLCVGGAGYWRALDHLKPEHRDERGMFVFWESWRYTAVGQAMLRRAWTTQLAGLALLGLATLLR